MDLALLGQTGTSNQAQTLSYSGVANRTERGRTSSPDVIGASLTTQLTVQQSTVRLRL